MHKRMIGIQWHRLAYDLPHFCPMITGYSASLRALALFNGTNFSLYCRTSALELASIPFQGASPLPLTRVILGRSSSPPERSLGCLNQPGTQLQKLIWVPTNVKAPCHLLQGCCHIASATTSLIPHIIFSSGLILCLADLGVSRHIVTSRQAPPILLLVVPPPRVHALRLAINPGHFLCSGSV